MRRAWIDESRETVSAQNVSTDYHFVRRLLPLLADSEATNEFQLDSRDARLLKAKRQRG